jgi:hypothetical protein
VPVRELIGRYVVGDAQMGLYRSRTRAKTIDETIPNYEFWDRLRRGKADGYKLGALFATRIERVIAAWVLGEGIEIALCDDDNELPEDRRDYTNNFLTEFVRGLLDAGLDADEDEENWDRDTTASLLMSIYRDALGLGDQWVIVNPDGTLSVPSPDTVEVKRDPLDYRRMLAVLVTTKLDGYAIVDEYRADGRTVTIKQGERAESFEYQNLIGRIPVVHFAYGMSGNETYGHSIHEQLLPLYDQYDDVLFKMLDGAKLLGNPILAFVGMEDISEVINANDPAQVDEYTDKDGNIAERPQLNVDSNAVMLIGKGGDAKFVAPPTGFTEDTKQALKTLFLLLLDHTGIPEFIWGNELSSARASSDTQMVQFVKDIGAWQRQVAGAVVRLCKIRLQVGALTDPRLIVGALKAKWPAAIAEDRELVRKLVETALLNGLLQRETALRLLSLVENPADEVEAAEEEAAERQAALYPDGDTGTFNRQLGAAERTAANEDEETDA